MLLITPTIGFKSSKISGEKQSEEINHPNEKAKSEGKLELFSQVSQDLNELVADRQ